MLRMHNNISLFPQVLHVDYSQVDLKTKNNTPGILSSINTNFDGWRSKLYYSTFHDLT